MKTANIEFKVGDVFCLKAFPTIIKKVTYIGPYVVEFVRFLETQAVFYSKSPQIQSRERFQRAYNCGMYVLIPDPTLPHKENSSSLALTPQTITLKSA
jgi:hypothetical protein